MKIYTSYIGMAKNIPDDIIKVSISLYPPKFVKFKNYRLLAPSESIFIEYKSGKIGEDGYIRRFKNEILKPLNIEKVIKDLMELSGGKDIVLLCFEKDKFCHRHIVSEWFNENGIECEEWSIKHLTKFKSV